MSTLEELRNTFGKIYGLNAEELAVFLRHSNNRGVVNKIREKMKNGHFPGAHKVDGHWQLPLPDLATYLNPPTPEPSYALPVIQGKAKRRRAILGPTIDFIRAGRFWEAVARAMGDEALASQVHVHWVGAHEDLKNHFAERKAARLKAELSAVLGDLMDGKPSKPKGRGPL